MEDREGAGDDMTGGFLWGFANTPVGSVDLMRQGAGCAGFGQGSDGVICILKQPLWLLP